MRARRENFRCGRPAGDETSFRPIGQQLTHCLPPAVAGDVAGLLVVVLITACIFWIANVATVAALRATHDQVCAGYTTYEAFLASCSSRSAWNATSPGGGGYWSSDCYRWYRCSQLAYEYGISAASLVVQMAFIVIGSIMIDAYNKLRKAVAGTQYAAFIGGIGGDCGGPTRCCRPILGDDLLGASSANSEDDAESSVGESRPQPSQAKEGAGPTLQPPAAAAGASEPEQA